MVRKTSKFTIKINSEKAFKNIFEEYYRPLFFYAKNILKDEAPADDIVQESFFQLWEKREKLEISSVSGLLYTDVRHRCLNYLKHEKIKEKHVLYEKYKTEDNIDSMLPLYEEELMRQINNLLDHLPNQQQEVLKFKINGDSISDIAEKMGISANTVKTHLLKARKFLRSKLKNSLYIVFLIKYSDIF